MIVENNVFVRTFNAVIATMKFTLNLNKKEFNMNKTVSKFALSAGVVLAVALTFSCSSDDGGGGESSPSVGGGESSSSEAESNNSAGVSSSVEMDNYPSSSSISQSSSSSIPSSSSLGGGYTGSYGSLPYEDQTYKTVEIGDQTWMAENLNYAVEGSKCYGEDGEVIIEIDYSEGINKTTLLSPAEVQANCDTYGRLYDWLTAMALPSSCNSSSCSSQINSPHRGICPSGWHIPNDDDWNVLMNYVGGSSTAGRYLKATSGWYNNGNGTDEYGFLALPGGLGSLSGIFFYGETHGNWWSATSEYEYGRNRSSAGGSMAYNDDGFYINGYGEGVMFSVRCLQD